MPLLEGRLPPLLPVNQADHRDDHALPDRNNTEIRRRKRRHECHPYRRHATANHYTLRQDEGIASVPSRTSRDHVGDDITAASSQRWHQFALPDNLKTRRRNVACR